MIRLLRVSLATLLLSPTGVSADDTPFLTLLKRVPANIEGELAFHDADAMRHQVQLFASRVDPRHLSMFPFANAYEVQGFQTNRLFSTPDGARGALGFNVFDIDQYVGWGRAPAGPVILTGTFDVPKIGTALTNREFKTKSIDGLSVWHRLDDNNFDPNFRNQDPFSGALGKSTRMAISDNVLISTFAWPNMETILANQSSLGFNKDIASILTAAYDFDDAGNLISAILPRKAPTRVLDPSVIIRSIVETGRKTPTIPDLPVMPAFSEYGIMLWQNGLTLTGGIAIPFVRRDTAQKALATFTQLLDTMHAPAYDKALSKILPYERHFEIIETKDRFVVVLAFKETLDLKDPITLPALSSNPRNTLVRLWITRDLDFIIGSSF